MQKQEETYVMGVGASAGGLNALSRLLASFNGTTHSFCVIVVQHLSPDYKSELTSILSRRCKWPVEEIENGCSIQPHRVYVTPPNRSIEMKDGKLFLKELPPNYKNAPSADQFLISLAKEKQQYAIGAILSGFGHDGTEGVRAIKEVGGFTIAQSPVTAEYQDMPQSAIDSGMVDMVLDPAVMFDEVTHYINNHRVLQSSTPRERSLDAIFELLAKRSGTDFSKYKSSTVMRRMDKRIEALRLPSHTEYYKMIRQNPKELDVLFETVLIGITEFFRNREHFDALRKELKLLLEEKRPGDSIRIWSVGCATGEEPYTIAMLISELLGENIANYQIQIFGSDIDERALNKARRGTYSAKSVEKLPELYINKYFDKTEEDQKYQIRKTLKKNVLFSKHDITNDPPFVKLDLITCRNLFIYFNNSLQKDTLRVFHYSLKENGLLFMGKSESITPASDLFVKVNEFKVFRKADAAKVYNLKFSRYNTNFGHSKTQDDKKTAVRNMSILDIAKETLYHANENPFVIINDEAEIKEVQGSLRLYLEIGQGAMNHNLLKMSNKEMSLEIRGLLAQARNSGKIQVGNVIKFSLFDQLHFVRIKILPFIYPMGEENHYLVFFERIEPDGSYLRLTEEVSTDDFTDHRILELEQELNFAREYMQMFTEELETNNEELQSLNEELQSANEELKSSNEELETSNEELQSANEELSTANNELRLSNEMIIEREEDLKMANREIIRNETLYRTISENIPNGTVGILNEFLEVEYLAGQGMARYNIDLQSVKGKKLHELNPSETERSKLHKIFSDTQAGQSCKAEFSYMDRIYSLHTIPLKLDEHSPTKVLYLTQDITEQKEFTNMLEREVSHRTEQLEATNTKLAEVNLNLQQYAYVASHDLQEPLRKIQMFIALMHKSLPENDKSLVYSDKVSRAAARMAALVNGILEYSRINEDEREFEVLRLDEILDHVAEDCDLLMQEKNARLSYQDLGEVRGIEIQMYQLFLNLVKNALKFNEHQPVIQVSSHQVQGDLLPENSDLDPGRNYNVITVQDNGIGFKPEYADNIFEMFKRLHSKDKYAGTGLGLALCRKIVEVHKGQIRAAGEEGKGAKFTIYLPMDK
ncbi:CheR family methyltransferase [Persicitalea jodogahamensis]|uniref:Protein-glutamate O-methyltransferase n=1 Tax=Persicitalea jodogahamensis TaxID=402147 RepID=A0A8J3D9T0_9BACT|nr:CheR family methyltransferase [Persicitalea jodogahamensis]GHB73349.1 hypothetical protein GCM10007390_29360 [Persicitalea jodogahamensis]